MADKVTIKVTSAYTHPTNPNSEVSNTDSVDDADTGDTLEGTADAQGTSTERAVTPAQGTTQKRKRQKKLPEGARFSGATVTITRDCGNQPDLSITAKGNVSVSARIDGNCIEATAVSRTETELHGEETVTTIYRKCCGEG